MRPMPGPRAGVARSAFAATPGARCRRTEPRGTTSAGGSRRERRRQALRRRRLPESGARVHARPGGGHTLLLPSLPQSRELAAISRPASEDPSPSHRRPARLARPAPARLAGNGGRLGDADLRSRRVLRVAAPRHPTLSAAAGRGGIHRPGDPNLSTGRKPTLANREGPRSSCAAVGPRPRHLPGDTSRRPRIATKRRSRGPHY